MTFRTIFESFLDFLYPPSCVACGHLLMAGDRHICQPCWSQVAFARDQPELAAEALLKMSPEVADVVSAFVFQKTGVLQSLIHALKYENANQVGVWLGERTADALIERVPPIDLIVPVPLHRAKERERGYNQAEMIARGMASQLGVRIETRLVRRARHTTTQTKLSIEQRRVNVADAFVVGARAGVDLRGATILVVDDVITTGATIAAVATTLRKAGAARVIAGSVALADHHA